MIYFNNFLKWLFKEEEPLKNENLTLVLVNGKIQVNESNYNGADFLQLSIINTYFFNRKLLEEVKEEKRIFKTNPKEIKQKYNYFKK